MNFTLSQEHYEALVALARTGATANNKEVELEAWLRLIEEENGVTRSFVMVQWDEADAPIPPGAVFPEKWPPERRATIELVTRPVARADVDKLLEERAKTPLSVLCTRDPAGRVGWTAIDAFFTN